MREIEIKARVEDKERLMQALAEKNIVLGEPKKQHDVVYCKPGQKEPVEGAVWLRIRTENEKKVILTLKKNTERKLDCIEHETEVSDGTELERIIKLLGNELFSDITKTRRKAKVGRIEICLDEIDGLGTFVEGEILTEDDADAQPVIDELWNFFESIGVSRSNEETTGYDILYKRKHGIV